LGWVRMSFSEASSRSSSVVMTGRRPTNSGIRPYLSRSSGSTSRKISPCFLSSGAMTLAPKPIEPGRLRAVYRVERQPHVFHVREFDRTIGCSPIGVQFLRRRKLLNQFFDHAAQSEAIGTPTSTPCLLDIFSASSPKAFLLNASSATMSSTNASPRSLNAPIQRRFS